MTKKCDKDEENALPKYLHRRDDGRSQNYYVRLVAPVDIQPFVNKKQQTYRESTGTADLRRATVIGAELVARKLREWQTLRESMGPRQKSVKTLLSKQLIRQIAGVRLSSWYETDNHQRYGDEGILEAELLEIEAFCKHSDGVMRTIISRGKGSPNWESVVEDVLDWCVTLGYDVDTTDTLFPDLIRAYAEAEGRAQTFIRARNRGDELPSDTILQTTGTCLSVMSEKYQAHKSSKVGKKTVSKNISIWEKFVAFKGDAFLDEVSSGDIYNFLEERLTTENRPWSQGYVDGHAQRALKEMFGLARTLNLMKAPNPLLNLETTPSISLDEAKARLQPRFPFTTEQLNIIFSSELYVPRCKYFKGKLASDFGVRYFGPLIGLLHGPRVREFLQLMTNDIVVVDNVPCFKFQVDFVDENSAAETTKRGRSQAKKVATDLPPRTLKNESVYRTIPIHPKLIDLGFLRYLDTRRKQSIAALPLFASALPEPGGESPLWGRAFEQSFLRYVRDKLGFGNGFGTHSFRHQFEDRIKDAQARRGLWPAGLAQHLAGRSMPRDTDRAQFREEGSEKGYGNGYQPTAVLPHFEKLDFSDIVFPAPYTERT